MMREIWNYVNAHSTTIVLAASILGTAFASTFPENRPKTLDDVWDWMGNFVHQLASVRRPTGNNSTARP